MPTFAPELNLDSLDGTVGFRINGEVAGDESGRSVASAGDVNGDGFDDLIIGAHLADPNGVDGSGSSYVVFGKAGGFTADLNLSSLDGTTGFRLHGEAERDHSGYWVASAGDINADGFDDLVIGAEFGGPNGPSSGASYVVFGKAGGFTADLNLSSLDGTTGFQMNGVSSVDALGRSVASAGDINGDGFDDLIVGAPNLETNSAFAGASYVVFGKAGGFTPDLDLSSLDGTTGFQINGELFKDFSGFSAASAGDINGDGFDDLIIGALGAAPNDNSYSGTTYVVFGKAGNFTARLELSSLDGTAGFKMNGEATFDLSGRSVASAGDINADGFDDLIIGARGAASNGNTNSGASYVVFGKSGGFAANLELSTLNGTTGFKINGQAAKDWSGHSVASAGDINGDGFDDLIIGAPRANSNDYHYAGSSYVVFGKAGGFAAELSLDSLDGTTGFQINGEAAGDYSGQSVASAGDINGDGFDDLIIGANESDPNGYDLSGASYVIFGRAPTEAVTRTGTAIDNTIRGGNFNDTLNGLGGDDNLFGSGGNDRLDGGTGKDMMDGGAGNDTYVIDNKGDSITETAGNDTVQSANRSLNLRSANLDGVENAELTGRAGKSLTGDNGRNKLIGNDGKNKIDGQKGNDKLEGGKKSDKFVFKTKYDKDTIVDFDAKGRDHDILDLRKLKSVKNYQDLIDNHMDQKGKHVIIDGGKGDEIKLLKVKLAHLDAGDFLI